MITIEEFMTENPYTLRASNLVSDAWAVMQEKNIRHVPITDTENHLLGLVTQRDVLAATKPVLQQDDEKVPHVVGMDMLLEDIMSHNVSTINQKDSLRKAAIFMQAHKYGCLPVINGKCLVGIITDSDFVSIAINLLEQVELSEEDFSE